MRNFLLCLTVATTLTACGGDTYVKVQGTTNISKGQELADLQRALDQGAISKKDYDQVRSKILERPQ
jgi:hypothetical protein